MKWAIEMDAPKCAIYVKRGRVGGIWTEDPAEAWGFASEEDAEYGARLLIQRRGSLRYVAVEDAAG